MPLQQENIYTKLKGRIIDLDYRPGQILNEKELVREFNTSRTPVREALLKLEQDDLVSIVPRKGTYVSQVDIRAARHAYEMKKDLEGLAAELAARRATREQIDRLLKTASEFRDLDNYFQYRKCIEKDRLFHHLTRLASGNPLLIQTLEKLSIITVRFLTYIQYVEKDYQWYQDSINAIASAIYERDAARARKEAEEHTAAFLTKLADYFFGESL